MDYRYGRPNKYKIFIDNIIKYTYYVYMPRVGERMPSHLIFLSGIRPFKDKTILKSM